MTTFESILPSIPLEAMNEKEDPKDSVERVLCELEDPLEKEVPDPQERRQALTPKKDDRPLTPKKDNRPLTPKEEAKKFLDNLMEALSVKDVLVKLQFLQCVVRENPRIMHSLDDPPGELMGAALVCKNRGFWSEDCAKAFQKVFLPLKASTL